jgi:hypothetical protein
MDGEPIVLSSEGAKYGASLGSALAIAISYTTNHPIPVGDHSRDLQRALRHLFRPVPSVASPRWGTVPCSRGAMEARYRRNSRPSPAVCR